MNAPTTTYCYKLLSDSTELFAAHTDVARRLGGENDLSTVK